MDIADVFGFGGKIAYVYGLGTTGKGTAQALMDAGVKVVVWDDSAEREKSGFEVKSPSAIDWAQVGGVVKSPGIGMQAELIKTAQAKGVPILSDVDLLWRREGMAGANFIGITGTNGKSTTTALVGHILREAGKKVAVGGNIGTAALALPELPVGGVYVLEFSSYQLETLRELKVDGGILLNLTPDHLARHGTMENYLAAKLRLFELANPGAVQVLGIDQPILQDLAGKGGFTTVSVQQEGTRSEERGTRGGHIDYTVWDGAIWHSGKRELELGFEHLPGPHNAQNVACAYALLVPRWVSHAQFVAGAKSFKGLPHRLEKVATVGGVTFINDSKATNGDSTVYALQSFENIYWICGGQPKTDGLGDCVKHLEAVRAAFTIGEATDAFAKDLDEHGVPVFKCYTLDVAVREAFAAARSEGMKNAVVMLSPAAASWDQFRNFEHRGDVFVNLVQNLVTAA
jgi:UDP-N-acetylmuramoylalanine--D-glutamate ligase